VLRDIQASILFVPMTIDCSHLSSPTIFELTKYSCTEMPSSRFCRQLSSSTKMETVPTISSTCSLGKRLRVSSHSEEDESIHSTRTVVDEPPTLQRCVSASFSYHHDPKGRYTTIWCRYSKLRASHTSGIMHWCSRNYCRCPHLQFGYTSLHEIQTASSTTSLLYRVSHT
jgi:hypothetical protein